MQIQNSTISRPTLKSRSQAQPSLQQAPFDQVTLDSKEPRSLNMGMGFAGAVGGAIFGTLTGAGLTAGGTAGVFMGTWSGAILGASVGEAVNPKSDKLSLACGLTGLTAGWLASAMLTGKVGGPMLIAGMGLAGAVTIGGAGLFMEP